MLRVSFDIINWTTVDIDVLITRWLRQHCTSAEDRIVAYTLLQVYQ